MSKALKDLFPSLSGKSSIRTGHSRVPDSSQNSHVSIPFREELHSDVLASILIEIGRWNSFHPFQGRAPFGPIRIRLSVTPGRVKVSIPFREELHSDKERLKKVVNTMNSGVSIPFREELHSDPSYLSIS